VRRVCITIGSFAPPLAALMVLVAGWVTPGYDPIARTVSRLAVPGAPAALATDLAIALAGLACVAVAVQVRAARAALVAAGAGFLVAAAIHLDPASAPATWSHRAASGIAVLGLTAAPLALWRRYGRVLLVLGLAEVAMLALALALLATPFNAWGALERVLLFLSLMALVIIARRIPSAEEAASASAVTRSSAETYRPVPSVNRAKP
jgi:hypothetical protein